MRELEIKILEIDRSSVEGQLRDSGAKCVYDGFVVDYRFNGFDDRKNSLRVRVMEDGCYVDMKIKKGEDKIRDRVEKRIEVSSPLVAFAFFVPAGFGLDSRIGKHRTTYELEGIRYEFDRLTGPHSFVPEYLEIEGPSREKVYAAGKALGFSHTNFSTLSVRKVIKHYKENGVHER